MPDLNAKSLNDIAVPYLAQRLGSLQQPAAAPDKSPQQMYQPSTMTPEEVQERATLLQQGENPKSHPRLMELNQKWLAEDSSGPPSPPPSHMQLASLPPK